MMVVARSLVSSWGRPPQRKGWGSDPRQAGAFETDPPEPPVWSRVPYLSATLPGRIQGGGLDRRFEYKVAYLE